MKKHVVKIKSINNLTENNNFIEFSHSTQQQRFQGLLVQGDWPDSDSLPTHRMREKTK